MTLADYVDRGLRRFGITISKPILAAICIIFGILVILLPSLLVWIVGLFLVIQGALLLTDVFEQESRITKMTAPKKYCLNCGAETSVGAVYCSQCGKKLRNPEQTSKV